MELRLAKCAVGSLYNILCVLPHITVLSLILSWMHLLPIWEKSCASAQIVRVKTDLG